MRIQNGGSLTRSAWGLEISMFNISTLSSDGSYIVDVLAVAVAGWEHWALSHQRPLRLVAAQSSLQCFLANSLAHSCTRCTAGSWQPVCEAPPLGYVEAAVHSPHRRSRACRKSRPRMSIGQSIAMHPTLACHMASQLIVAATRLF